MSAQARYAEKAFLLKTTGTSATDVGQEYWHQLIGEQAAGAFLNLTTRTLQGWRYKGGGPQYIRVSARCIRYRRADLREWAEARLRSSTSDQGTEVS